MAGNTASRKGVQGRKRATRRRRPLWVRTLKISLSVLLLLVMGGAIAVGSVFLVAWRQARETLVGLDQKISAIAETPSQIIASDGKTVLYSVTQEYRDKVDYRDIPKRVIMTTLAAEDKRFHDHNGVDFRALGRVLFAAAKDGEFSQGGGSTLTMQLAKRLFTSTEKTFSRKIMDIALAMNMEKMLTKEQIIELYLNQVFYGNGAYGVKAAAETYFGKGLDDLTLGEAAMLARLVRTPTRSNPYNNLKLAVQGRDTVLKIMRDEGWIDEGKYREALDEKVKLAPRRFGSGERIMAAPYFVRHVLDELQERFPDVPFGAGGYRVETTLDPSLQAEAEEHVSDFVRRYRRNRITTAATLVLDSDGRILAMVGGADFRRNEYNVITQGRRQPGSSFKPFVYAAALSTGAIGPRSRISNERFSWLDPASGEYWTPKNSGGGYGGSYSVRDAIAWSKNVPAVRVAEMVTPQTVQQYARDVFGFTSAVDPVLSVALGTSAVSPLEMAQAYSVFQLGGSRATPYAIIRIIAPDERVLKVFSPDIREGLLDPAVAGQMDTYLRAVVTSGTGRRAGGVDNARGKTGTTQDNRDAWFCGYTNNMVCIAWVANEQYDPNHNPKWYYEPMPRVFGGTYTIELWANIMKDAQRLIGKGVEREYVLMDATKPAPTTDRTDEQDTAVDDVNPDDSTVPGAPTDAQSAQPTAEPQPPVETPPPGDEQAEPPPSDPPADPPVQEAERVSLEICVDSGLKATIYCPETVTRTYTRVEAPKRWCRQHGGR